MGNQIIAGDALARALSSRFRNTWQRRHKGLEADLGRFMELGISSDKFEEIYGYDEVAMYPERRPWGQDVASKPHRFRNFTVQNVAWDSNVEWFKHHRLFDQLKVLERSARRAGVNYGTLPERVAFQIIQGTTDRKLLGTIPNAPDGVGIYSALDGDSSNRFQVSGGNIESGTGIGSSAAVRTDVFNAIERIGSFLDPEGEPAFDPGVIDQGITVLFGIANTQVVREAFVQARTLDGGAAVTNITQDSGMQFHLVPSARITNNAIFVFIDEMDPKPIFEQVAQPLDEQIQVEENSDIARKSKREGIFWETIRGYGVNLPLGTVRITNA